MTAVSKNVYIDKLDHIVNKHNNAYHKTSKMKPVDIKSKTYIDFNKEINSKDPKFKIGDIFQLSKFKNIFQKATPQVGQKEFLLLKKLKILCRGHLLLAVLKEKKLLERFTKKNCKNQIKKSLELKGYNRSFNSWTDKKDMVQISEYFPEPKSQKN